MLCAAVLGCIDKEIVGVVVLDFAVSLTVVLALLTRGSGSGGVAIIRGTVVLDIEDAKYVLHLVSTQMLSVHTIG